MIHDSVLEAAGRTPLVRLRQLTHAGSEIVVKLESFNPGRSIKDRSAFFMIEEAERHGRLRPGGTIVESTSGNLGKSLALVGAVKGYRVVLVIDPKTPASVVRFTKALGAELDVVDTPDEDGGFQRPRIRRVRQLVEAIPGAYWPDQYNNPDNPRVHALTTAHEILDDASSFDALIASVSTGGHLAGLARTVKRHLPEVRVVGVDAAGSAAFGYPFTGYRMRGLGLAWEPGNLGGATHDASHLVADHEGIATARLLARCEGLLVGESSGAVVFSALCYTAKHPGSRVVAVAADDGANYLDESFDDDWLQAENLAEAIRLDGLDTLEGLKAGSLRPSHGFVDQYAPAGTG